MSIHSLTAVMHINSASNGPCPVLCIDGVPLSDLLAEMLGDDDLAALVPAQGWLIDDVELQLARQRIHVGEHGISTTVPLLICSDDLDLSCTVLIAEQEVTDDAVIWRRFGLDQSPAGHQVGTSVRWDARSRELAFDKAGFVDATARFIEMCDREWI